MKRLLLLILLCIVTLTQILATKYYVGQATASVNLRNEASVIGEKLCTIPKGSYVAIALEEDIKYDNDDFVSVIYVDKDLYGYAAIQYFRIIQEIDVNEDGVLTKVGTLYDLDPQIEIYNHTLRDITVQINNSKYKFESEEKRTITCAPGAVKVIASSKGVLPFICTDIVEENGMYSWTFYIEQK